MFAQNSEVEQELWVSLRPPLGNDNNNDNNNNNNNNNDNDNNDNNISTSTWNRKVSILFSSKYSPALNFRFTLICYNKIVNHMLPQIKIVRNGKSTWNRSWITSTTPFLWRTWRSTLWSHALIFLCHPWPILGQFFCCCLFYHLPSQSNLLSWSVWWWRFLINWSRQKKEQWGWLDKKNSKYLQILMRLRTPIKRGLLIKYRRIFVVKASGLWKII